MAETAGGIVGRREALIAAGGFAGQGRAGEMLGAAYGPLEVHRQHEGHGQAAGLLDRKIDIDQPRQVHKVGLAGGPLIRVRRPLVG